jgi:hypothetical protein
MTTLVILGILTATGDLPRSGLDEVVGSYYHGDGLGTNCTLTVGENGRFSYVWTGCLGVYEQDEGKAEIAANGCLVLHPEGNRTSRLKTRYVPVRWDERLYLIPEDQVVAFRTTIEKGNEPRTGPHGWFYLRDGDWKKKVQGQPALGDQHP